jgi:hypothetical protein
MSKGVVRLIVQHWMFQGIADAETSRFSGKLDVLKASTSRLRAATAQWQTTSLNGP